MTLWGCNKLTDLQLRVLELAAEGLTQDEIAARLGVSVQTIKSHLKAIRLRLAARSTPHAVAIGFRVGLLEAHELGRRVTA
jgi:DNA-binding CsgD family transcriptional regulator